ncbi:acid phosphatase [Phenylobacterium glaciei]|nr:phosphatase PAP2 family protein [Phenylobacterium glaciei]
MASNLALGGVAAVAVLAGVAIGAFGAPLLKTRHSGPVIVTSDDGSGVMNPEGGYLTPDILDAARLLPPPPLKGSMRYEQDRKVFLATRALKGTPRWNLATADADQSIQATLANFSCSVGADLTPSSVPAMAALLEKVTPDEMRAVNTGKLIHSRQRPFLIDAGEICVPKTDELARSPDYPSGHTTWSWMTALLLAEMVPERATDILIRGRVYGESRVICGAHNESAVEAGRINASALVAALHASPQFRDDLDLARAELASVRRSGRPPSAARCVAEEELSKVSYF